LFANNQNPGSQDAKGVICANPLMVPGFGWTCESNNFTDVPPFTQPAAGCELANNVDTQFPVFYIPLARIDGYRATAFFPYLANIFLMFPKNSVNIKV